MTAGVKSVRIDPRCGEGGVDVFGFGFGFVHVFNGQLTMGNSVWERNRIATSIWILLK
ncbi:MAG: hypothetical protein WKF77_25620 [Planctomycetaceae bacterium]